ncbi:MAG: hypothetical protein IJ718_05085 [Paludibacteraceae bacterium]|nr:hypothetical protein [Paludibacteraceae bacterium]
MKRVFILLFLVSMAIMNCPTESYASAVSTMQPSGDTWEEDGWTVTGVYGYDRYGNYMSIVHVARKYVNGRMIYKAKLNGSSGDYCAVIRGTYRCGDMTLHFKYVDMNIYFDL